MCRKQTMTMTRISLSCSQDSDAMTDAKVIRENDELRRLLAQAESLLASDRTVVKELLETIFQYIHRSKWPPFAERAYQAHIDYLLRPSSRESESSGLPPVHQCPICRKEVPCELEGCEHPLETSEGAPLTFSTCGECLEEMSKQTNAGTIPVTSGWEALYSDDAG